MSKFEFPAHHKDVEIGEKTYRVDLSERTFRLVEGVQDEYRHLFAAAKTAAERATVDKQANYKICIALLGRDTMEDLFDGLPYEEINRMDLTALVVYLSKQLYPPADRQPSKQRKKRRK